MASAPTYGGDEVAALIIDQGSEWTRAGFAGEDTPKAVVPSAYGVGANPNYDPEVLPEAGDANGATSKVKYYFGDNSVNLPRPDVEIKNAVEDGIVTDWDTTQLLWKYALEDVLGARANEQPLLITEQIWNTDANRIKAMEVAFEGLQVPAFYIARRPACTLFAAGKGSGLVVNVGADIATVTPVMDGLALYKPSRRSRQAGDYCSKHVLQMLGKKNLEIVPRYLVKTKEVVALGEPAKYTPRSFAKAMTTSFHDYQVQSVLTEFKESMVQIHDAPLSDSTDTQIFTERAFEFPDGSSREFGIERFEIGESLFRPRDYVLKGTEIEDPVEEEDEGDDKADKTNGSKEAKEKEKATQTEKELNALIHTDRTTGPFTTTGVSSMIIDSINACDVDIRANLANNIVITGGSTLLQGFTDRINEDLTQALPGYKIRIQSPGNLVERKHSAWIGGSILASLGTFHQLWISKKEYDEVGPAKLLEKRFR